LDARTVWLIRHGESEGNRGGRIQGWLDLPLTELGRRQARRIAQRLASAPRIDALVASPLTRAAETAAVIGAALGLPVRSDERLREYGFGPLQGLTREEIAERYPRVWGAWQRNQPWAPLAGEEGEEAFHARVSAAADEAVGELSAGGSLAIVSHGGTQSVLLEAWLGITGRGWRTFAFDNASVSLAELRPNGAGRRPPFNVRLHELNDVAHLDEVPSRRASWLAAPWSQAT